MTYLKTNNDLFKFLSFENFNKTFILNFYEPYWAA